MSRANGRRRAWLIGALPALLLAIGVWAQLPLLVALEARAGDWLFRNGRLVPPEPSKAIVHVDIDDNALDSVGRWPWPRSTLANGLRALDSFGPRVIVLDLLLSDPQEPAFDAGGKRIDHDAVLAKALADLRAHVVLAVQIEAALPRPEPALRELLERDITLTADELIEQLSLEAAAARRLRGELRALKRAVLLDADGTEEEVREAYLPSDKAYLGVFPELRLIREAVARRAACRIMGPSDPVLAMLYPEAEAPVLPPLPGFARAARGFGIVNADPDADGQLRRVTMHREVGRLIVPTLGRSAAAAYENRPAGSYELLGSGTLPIPWPRIDAEGPVRALAPHLSLGGFVSLARAEAALAAEVVTRAALTRELVRAFLQQEYDPAHPEFEAELREEIGFQLDGVEEETRETRAMREWLRRSEEVVRARQELRRVRGELRPKLADKLVFVGWNATGSGDFYPTVAHERTPGVVVHAAVASAALSGYAVRHAHVFWDGLVVLLLGLIASRICARARGPLAAFLRSVLLGLAYVAINAFFVFGDRGLLLALFGPSAAVALGWAGTAITVAVRERRERARLERQFGARISKQLFDHLLANPDVVQLAGREREVTCFFADLAGFTALSESLDSESTVVVLNRFMRAMNEELTRHGAYVNKFLGDGLMAVWGAFDSDEEQATRACRAALDCQKRLEQLNTDLAKERLPRLSMRIGITTGTAVVGDCGAPPELSDYTVIGDPVNLAARLEAAGKQLGASTLIDGGTRRHVTDAFLARPLGRFTVVGQRTPADLFELLAPAGSETEPQHELFSRTARAVALYQERELEAALDAWREIEAEHGSSGLVRLYAAAIEHARTHPDEPFDGVLRLAHK